MLPSASRAADAVALLGSRPVALATAALMMHAAPHPVSMSAVVQSGCALPPLRVTRHIGTPGGGSEEQM